MALAERQAEGEHGRGQVEFAGLDVDRTVVWLSGEHDLSTVAELSETLGRVMALDDADLVVDLSAVEFMGVAAVKVILRAHDFLKLRSRSLELRAPSASAQLVLDACGLSSLVDSYPGRTRRSAKAAARRAATATCQ